MEIPAAAHDAARRRHYSTFYDGTLPEHFGVVLGNCQAESLRIALTGDDLPTVRIPPVHELVASDMPFLQRVLAAASAFVSQPIRDDYRGLPVGTRQVVASLAPSCQVAVVPAIRHRSLHPMQTVVRIPGGPVDDPPIVAYHDLRSVASAAGQRIGDLTPDRIRHIAKESTRELRVREERAGAVAISDLFAKPHFGLLRTFNHPGNPVWIELAGRVRAHLGRADVTAALDRQLLTAVIAPRESEVIDAWSLDEKPSPFWTVEGTQIHRDDVEQAHRRWYAEHPEVVEWALRQNESSLRLLAAT